MATVLLFWNTSLSKTTDETPSAYVKYVCNDYLNARNHTGSEINRRCVMDFDFLKLNLFVSWATFVFQALCKKNVLHKITIRDKVMISKEQKRLPKRH